MSDDYMYECGACGAEVSETDETCQKCGRVLYNPEENPRQSARLSSQPPSRRAPGGSPEPARPRARAAGQGNQAFLTIATVILAIGLLAASALAYSNHDLAQRNGAKARDLNDRLGQASKDLNDARDQVKTVQAQLAQVQAALGQTQGQLSEAQKESQKRLSIIFSQQENVKVLKSCLAGVASDDAYFRKGVDAFVQWVDNPDDTSYRDQATENFDQGKRIMDSVEDDCNKASHLFD